MDKSTLTLDYLKSVLSYDPDTGIFGWKEIKYPKKDGSVGWRDKRGYLRISVSKKKY